MDFLNPDCILHVYSNKIIGDFEGEPVINSRTCPSYLKPNTDMVDSSWTLTPQSAEREMITVTGSSSSHKSSGPMVREGTRGDDYFLANDKDEEVYGFEGDDTYIKPNGSCFISYVEGKKYIDMGSGDDVVRFNLSSQRQVNVLLGDGNDNFEMSSGISKTKAKVNGGSGQDFISISGSGWKPIAKGGKGDDTILIGNGNIVDQATIFGGKGTDMFEITHGASFGESKITFKDFSIKDSDMLYMYISGNDNFEYKQKGDDLHIFVTPGKNASANDSYRLEYILEGVSKKKLMKSGLVIEGGLDWDWPFECFLG